MDELLAETGQAEVHRERLLHLVGASKGEIRIASAYVTDSALLGNTKRRRRLLTPLLPMDIVSGATSLKALQALIKSGVECRRPPNAPHLHAKVYIFGNDAAVVSSANMTGKAMTSNIEVGVQVDGGSVAQLIRWFDAIWDSAHEVTESQLQDFAQELTALREEYQKVVRKVRGKSISLAGTSAEGKAARTHAAIKNAQQHFLCNTNRRYSQTVEDAMRLRKYAAAWESFNYPGHVQRVNRGDLIFMYAKGTGIIGVGVAKSGHEIVQSGDPSRLRSPLEYDETEWRVPVEDWLVWVDDPDAFNFKSGNYSFLDISGDDYEQLRFDVLEHFALR